MDSNNKKPSLKELKSKLLAKLVGKPRVQNVVIDPSVHQDRNTTSTSNSSTPMSGLDDSRAEEVRQYGATCCPKRAGQNGSEIFVSSSPYLSDDEGSGSDLAKKRGKRKKRCISAESRKPAFQPTSSSSSGSSQVPFPYLTNDPSSLAGTSLTKSQKRKLKTVQINKDKNERMGNTEFSSDSKI